MPRPPLHPLLALVAVALLLGATPAVAESPPGFTDGVPVGTDDGAPAVAAAGAVGAAATQRHFGAEAYLAVRGAVSSTSRTCTISDDVLTAMVLAPVFKESSAATTPSTAPSPMTLSRYDEWNGVFSSSMGTPENNYGLYAFRDPATPYRRAFWSPGIGIWQYDSAGLGAPLTTTEAMDVNTVAADVARIMSVRYCSSSATTAEGRRYSAWTDWGYPCTLCEGFFDEMMGTTPPFTNLVLVSGISALGGVQARTCTLMGVSSTLPCWYVNPAVGVIQGATAWATLPPADGGSNVVAPTPLPLPFYVVDRGATEQRHWLRVDTGYGIDIQASRQIGRNARPVSTQAGSGLTWTSGSVLCDVTATRGACGPVAPSGVSSKAFTVAGSYRPVAFDANGDGKGDMLWYAPGSGPDYLWIGTGAGTFSSTTLDIRKTYELTVLDADGDADDDLILYERATGAANLWRYTGGGFVGLVLPSPVAGRTAVPVDIDDDPASEVVWYAAGSVTDAQWDWTGSTFAVSPLTINGTYRTFTGDFDGNGRDDIFWYAPGAAADSIWFHARSGGVTAVPVKIQADYITAVGDLDGDHRDDIVWHGPGSLGDSIWFGEPGGTFGYQQYAVNRTYVPVVADPRGTGRDAVIWYAPGLPGDAMWSWSAGRVLTSEPLALATHQEPVVGPFSAGGADGIFWYGAGSALDLLWYR